MRFFCPSGKNGYLGGQMGDKMGDNLQILKLKIDNLQKWTEFKCLKLRNLRAIFADGMRFFAKNHFPTQNLLSDAEFRKYIPQDLIVCDLSSRDFGEEEEAVADVTAEEVA